MECVTTTTLNSEAIDKGRWQWQLNTDPFSKSEEPQWEFYSLDDNYLIEKAYFDQEAKVELKDYIINIKHMIQIKKVDVRKQRPIRRIDWKNCIEEMDRSERYFETEKPKTINKIFGRLGDLIGFFSRRSPEIWSFASQLEKIEKEKDVESLKKDILPKLICCLEELVKPILEQSKDPELSRVKKNRIKRHEELILLFKEEFFSFEEFYERVLRAYTMNTCLYENLNKYLRNESWSEVDSVLSYALCLCKAFFHFRYQINSMQDNKEMQISSQKTEPILLYRGTAFDESALNCYYEKIVEKYFSWNSLTSTTTSRTVAEGFMHRSVDLKNKKDPVLFIIEIPIFSDSIGLEYLEWMNIYNYSAHAQENEVILPPGSVFEIVGIATDRDKKTTIRLKLKNEIKSLARGGLIMQGALQSKMMTATEAKVVCLEGEELVETLKCLDGNKLIEDIEFSFCTFDNKSLRIMIEILATLKRAKELKFNSCIYNDKEKIPDEQWTKAQGWNISKITIFEIKNFCDVFPRKNENGESWMPLIQFSLQIRGRGNAQDYQMLQDLNNWTQLTSLTLDFSKCKTITYEGINSLASEGIQNLTHLTSLTLDFSQCEHITDIRVRNFAFDGLRHLTKLTSLSVNFSHCSQITDDGVWWLTSKGLQYLTQLTSLTLNFSECKQITEEGIRCLVKEGLQHLTQLTALTLHLCQRDQIADIQAEGIECFTKLMSLTLSFTTCFHRTDGVCVTKFAGLPFLPQLVSLSVNSTHCPSMTDEEVRRLVDKGLRDLTQLTSLTLKIHSGKVTDAGMSYLVKQGLLNLSKLTNLSLIFGTCKEISDRGVRTLALEGFQHLSKLTSLTLGFQHNCNITDKGVQSLAAEGLRHLDKLTSLTLDFPSCPEITDEGIRSLATEGLQYLNQLASLTFSFPNSVKVTEKGVLALVSEGLRHLTKLISLTLDFPSCPEITDQGICSFAPQILKYLSQMVYIPQMKKSLVFEFNSNNLQAQKALEPLESSEGVWALKRIPDNQRQPVSKKEAVSLTHQEQLCLFKSSQTSEQSLEKYLFKIAACQDRIDFPFDHSANLGLETLSFISGQFSHLACLNLHFSDSNPIGDEGIWNLVFRGIKNLKQLTSLALRFSGSKRISEKEIEILAADGLQNLNQLRSLTLEFNRNSGMFDDGIHIMASQGLQSLKQLISLTLCFYDSKGITYKGVHSLATEGLKNLIQLESLALNFSKCDEIETKALCTLASEGIQHLTQLTSLDLDLSSCQGLTDEGVCALGSKGLQCLKKLTSLKINFSSCWGMTDKAVQSLATQGLRPLVMLTSLVLNLHFCSRISDEGISILGSEGLSNLLRLESLTLDLHRDPNITQRAVDSMISKGLKDLAKSTAYLVSESKEITDEGICHLAFQGLKHLTQLKSLKLDFRYCEKLTDFGVSNLASHGLQHLTQLTSLTLSFNFNEQIADEGLRNLAFQGLRHLTQLNSLEIDFRFCTKITDEGVTSLISHGLKSLAQLISLNLIFSGCHQITEFTWFNITKVLHYLGFTQASNTS